MGNKKEESKITVNSYFNHLTNNVEQNFFEDLVVENIRASGMDVKYLPRTHGIDDILREPKNSVFDRAFIIEAYFHDVGGFGGEGDLMTKFGFTQPDTASISIAKRSWRDLRIPDRLDRPREGDLVYLPFSKSLFEIMFVEHEDPFWQLGRYNVFKVKLAMYTRGYNEKFTTPDVTVNGAGAPDNVDEIDSAINSAITSKASVLVNFDEANPFGDL